MSVGDRAKPVEHLDQVEGGLVVDAEFVEPGRQSTPVFAPAEAAFDLVAAAVGVVGVEGGWAAAARAAAFPVGDLIVGLRDRRADPLTA
jgi:hypothetical protein